MNPAEIAAKSVEISKSFINHQPGFHESDLLSTIQSGNLARLAVNIRQTEIVDLERLDATAYALKIPAPIVRSALLPQLEGLGWVELIKQGKKIIKIKENIPPVSSVLEELGKEWETNDDTSDIDRFSVSALGVLSKAPILKSAVPSELNFSNDAIMKGIAHGKTGNYFGSFNSGGSNEVLWSPYYFPGNQNNIMKFLESNANGKYGVLSNLTKKFQKYPGLPYDHVADKTNRDLIMAGIKYNFFQGVSMTIKDKNYGYIFPSSPLLGIDKKSDIFEKARMIVAAIRHGQYDAEVTKILYPRSILRKLREGGLKSHTYTKYQYYQLIANNICKPVATSKFGGIGYRIEFIDSPENNIAADIADEMLKGEETHSMIKDVDAQAILIKNGLFNYSTEQRRMAAKESIASSDEFERMMAAFSGEHVVK